MVFTRAADFHLEGIVIRDCSYSDESNVPAVIEAHGCNSNLVTLTDVRFEDNLNLGGSTGFSFPPARCYEFKMHNVSFEGNRYSAASMMPQWSQLEHVSFIDNAPSGRNASKTPMFTFPSGTDANLSSSFVKGNKGTLIQGTEMHLSILDAVFERNAIGSQKGLLVLTHYSRLTISDSVFLENWSKRRSNSAVIALFMCSSGHFSLNHFSRNLPGGHGILHLHRVSQIEIFGDVFSRNAAETRDRNAVGVIHIRRSCPLQRTSIAVKTSAFLDNSVNFSDPIDHIIFAGPVAAGAINIEGLDGSSIVIESSTFHNNTVPGANKGVKSIGAVAVTSTTASTMVIANSTFESNAAGGGPGAIGLSAVDGQFFLNSTVFTQNRAGRNRGAGGVQFYALYYNMGAVLTITDCVFTDHKNGALSAFGPGSRLTLVNTTFGKNNAFEGGAVSLSRIPSFQIQNCTFEANTASGRGGAIVVREVDSSLGEMHGTLFIQNRAKSGGAIFTESFITTLDCRFENNSAEETGGAVSERLGWKVLDEGRPCSRHCGTLFAWNNALEGGALYLNRLPNFYAENCTFHQNHASERGGAVSILFRSRQSVYEIIDSRFRQNEAHLGGKGVLACFLGS